MQNRNCHGYPDITNSRILLERAEKLIPSATQTLAKGPTQHVRGIAPAYLAKGKGAHVWDVDGNEYIDYNMAIGPLILGYCYPAVDEAIRNQLENGITFSLMHPLEVEVAELINEIIPNAECIRYSKTGADVTSAAIRIARAYTGKNKILCCGYHGWHDWYASCLVRNAGIPEQVKNLTYTFSYNDIDSFVHSLDGDIAAVILEPVTFEEPRDSFLHKIAEICKNENIVLIFDEMWTGFRMALGGAQEYFGIKADLATFSKAVANGMPLSILTGRKELMKMLDEDVFFYTTFGGEALSLAAAKATIKELIQKDVTENIAKKGKYLKNCFNEILKALNIDYVRIIGYDFRTMVVFEEKAGDPLLQKSFVQQELLKMGILWSGFHNISYSHTWEDIDKTLEAYQIILEKLDMVINSNSLRESIDGEPIKPTLRKVMNFDVKPILSR